MTENLIDKARLNWLSPVVPRSWLNFHLTSRLSLLTSRLSLPKGDNVL